MKFHPTKVHIAFVCFVLSTIYLILGCSKDNDLLLDSVLEENSVVTVDESNEDVITETAEVAESTTEDVTAEIFESRTTSFSPTDDAHVQSGKGYNQNIIRLEENHRTSYLMFDLEPITTVDGTISKLTLQITINSDDGNGSISVHKGESNDWSEENLSDSTVPESGILLGQIIKEYKIGTTEVIELDITNMQAELTTLVLNHENGNDLAFASKEHVSKIGPKLVVTYTVPSGSDEILINEEENTSEGETTTSETTTSETTTSETTTSETTTLETTTSETTTSETTTSETTTLETQNTEPIAVADATPSSGGVPLEVTFMGSNSSDDSKIDSYVWNFKDGATATSSNPTHTFTEIGVYEVELTVKDQQGLSNTDVVTITVTEKQNEAPKAIVSATPITGEAPLEVTFTGSASTDDNSISSYAWDYKDGQKGNTANPKHTYTKAGIYEVVLTVKDENGLSNTATVTITIQEPTNEAPIAIATANKTSGVAPLDVQFEGNKSTDDKEVTTFQWDFKDGALATNANPSHTFTTAGTYNVNLTVKDEEGLSSQKAITITVTEPQNQPPVAKASANPTAGEAPLLVQFLGNSSTDDKAITNYLWNFKDGATATNSNTSHTFTSAGSYVVDLTVKDAEGASSTKSVTITVTASVDDGGGTAPPGYYVSTSGNASNDGKSPSKPWSLEHAFDMAQSGDIVYVKAGNYGYKQLVSRRHGNQSNPIKFIGYTNTPGDLTSNSGSSFKYGESINANKMPLLKSSNGQGTAITIYHQYLHIENFQITNYNTGVTTISAAKNLSLKNLILINLGNLSNPNVYTGTGMSIKGQNTKIENCFVLNAGAEAIKLANADNSRISYSSIYADNIGNPTDYYFLIAGGTSNAVIENSYVQRASNLSHGGHGYVLKGLAENNTIRNCTAKGTSFELNFSGVRYNTIDNCKITGYGTASGNWKSRMVIFNGANNNTIKNMVVENTWTAFMWLDNDDSDGGIGLNEASCGYDNVFDKITVRNVNSVLRVGEGRKFNSWASRNTFMNSDFSHFNTVAVTYTPSRNIIFKNSSFKNGQKLVVETGGIYAPYSDFDVSWQNCTWANVNFNPPN